MRSSRHLGGGAATAGAGTGDRKKPPSSSSMWNPAGGASERLKGADEDETPPLQVAQRQPSHGLMHPPRTSAGAESPTAVLLYQSKSHASFDSFAVPEIPKEASTVWTRDSLDNSFLTDADDRTYHDSFGQERPPSHRTSSMLSPPSSRRNWSGRKTNSSNSIRHTRTRLRHHELDHEAKGQDEENKNDACDETQLQQSHLKSAYTDRLEGSKPSFCRVEPYQNNHYVSNTSNNGKAGSARNTTNSNNKNTILEEPSMTSASSGEQPSVVGGGIARTRRRFSKSGVNPNQEENQRNVGAFAAGGRAFGERPVWAVSTASSQSNLSAESDDDGNFDEGRRRRRHSAGSAISSCCSTNATSRVSGSVYENDDGFDPLMPSDDEDDGDDLGTPRNGNYGNRDDEGVYVTNANGFLVGASTRLVARDGASAASDNTESLCDKQSRSKLVVMLFVVLIMVLVVLIATTTAVPMLLSNRDDSAGASSGDNNQENEEDTRCIEFLDVDMKNQEQPDIFWQCRCQGHISMISETTHAIAHQWQNMISQRLQLQDDEEDDDDDNTGETTRRIQRSLGKLLGATPSGRILADNLNTTSTSISEANGSLFEGSSSLSSPPSQFSPTNLTSDCNNVRNIALLDLSTLHTITKEDMLQRYALAVVLSDTQLPGWSYVDSALNDNRTVASSCEWPGVFCRKQDDKDDQVVVANVELRSQSLTGSIAPEVGLLSGLEIFDLALNRKIGGTVPSQIGLLDKLESLILESCAYLGGTIPSEIGMMASLKVFDLTMAEGIKGELPSETGNLRNLETLYLEGNSLSGLIPSEVFTLESLVVLRLSSNLFSGHVSGHLLASLTSLGQLSLSQNNFEPIQLSPFLTNVSHLVNLTELDIESMGIQGTLSGDFFTGSSNIEYLSLENNLISGTIPTEVGEMTSLRTLVISRNKLTGSIPSEIGAMRQLQDLDLSSNGLGGEIPSELNLLSNLERLRLFGNSFTGGSLEVLCGTNARSGPVDFTIDGPTEQGMSGDHLIACSCCEGTV